MAPCTPYMVPNQEYIDAVLRVSGFHNHNSLEAVESLIGLPGVESRRSIVEARKLEHDGTLAR